VAFSSKSDFIVAGGEDKKIRLWGLDGKIIKTLAGQHDDWIRSVRVLCDDKYVISGSADKKLYLWKINDDNKIVKDDKDVDIIDKRDDRHNSWIRSIAVSPDEKFIVTSSNDKTLCLWNINRSLSPITIDVPRCFRQEHQKEVLSVAFSPDGKYIASGSADKSIKIWDINGNVVKKIDSAHQDRVLSVAFSPDGKYIASASYDNTICVWNRENGNEIWRSKLEDKVRSVAFSPIEEFPLIVSGSRDGSLQFWSLEEGHQIGIAFKGHQEIVRSIKFSHDGKSFVSASDDGTLCLWEAGNWQDWYEACYKRILDHQSYKEFVQTLTSPLRFNQSSSVVISEMNAFGKIAIENSDAADKMLDLLSNRDNTIEMKESIIRSLGKVANGNNKAIDRLIPILNSTQYLIKTRKLAADSLVQIDRGYPATSKAMADLLTNKKLSTSFKDYIAASLKKIDPSNSKLALYNKAKAKRK
jgi:WD40 repeat protein